MDTVALLALAFSWLVDICFLAILTLGMVNNGHVFDFSTLRIMHSILFSTESKARTRLIAFESMSRYVKYCSVIGLQDYQDKIKNVLGNLKI